MKKIVIIFLLILLLESVGFTQVKNAEPAKYFRQSVGTLYSPSYILQKLSVQNFRMSHSFSTSFSSGGGTSYLSNLYMNRISFDFSFPLHVQMDLGILSFPYFSGDQWGNPGNQLIGNIELTYRPVQNMMIGLQLYKGPMMVYPYGTYPIGFRPVQFFQDN